MSTSATVRAAIKKAGGQSKVASALGVKQPSVWEWIDRGRVPADRCMQLAELSGVSVHDLRPDVFGSRSRRK